MSFTESSGLLPVPGSSQYLSVLWHVLVAEVPDFQRPENMAFKVGIEDVMTCQIVLALESCDLDDM
jgi:hypothetical protein